MHLSTIPFERAAGRRLAFTALLLLAGACAGSEEEPVSTPPPEAEAAEAVTVRPPEPQPAQPVPAADPDTAPPVEAVDQPPSVEDREETWTGPGPAPLPGAILPARRIIAYYGNPLSERMGILGALPPEQMLDSLEAKVQEWNAADPDTPAVPALHLIAVVAHADPGWDGKYRGRVSDEVVERVAGWAEQRDALLFLDIQPALSTIQEELPRLEQYLQRPNVHLGLDPEFSMKQGHRPGTRIGTLDAEDINYAIDFLAELVERYDLPPKVLVVHRFTSNMITNTDEIRLRPEVQVVIHMDGWGPPSLKRQSYETFVADEPVQFTGFKLFYHNDTKSGHPLMTPEQILELEPEPVYIQYH